MKIKTSSGKTIEIEPSSKSLMKILLEHQIPVASSCNGDGICAKCRVEVTQGQENLSPANEAESLLKNKFRFDDRFRISCQCHVLGDVSLKTSYW